MTTVTPTATPTATARRRIPSILRWTALLAVVVVIGAVVFLLGAANWRGDAADPSPREAVLTPGAAWDGQGASGLSEADAAQFDAYPLLWLGPTFGGYHLQAIVRQEAAAPAGAPAHAAVDSVSFLYGECAVPTNAISCAAPLTLHVEPGCMARPEWTAGVATATTARGEALLRTFPDGHIRLWTGTISVYLNAVGNAELTRAAVNHLTGLNALAAPITAGSALAAPDHSACPPVEVPPLSVTATAT